MNYAYFPFFIDLKINRGNEGVRRQLVKQFTVNSLRAAKVIELRDIHRGKSFRLIAELYVDGQIIEKELVSKK